jgi:hypothetical protein
MAVRRTDLFAAALHGFPSPVPTQNVSSDESIPRPQSRQQRKVEVRVTELADQEAKRHGFTRRLPAAR